MPRRCCQWLSTIITRESITTCFTQWSHHRPLPTTSRTRQLRPQLMSEIIPTSCTNWHHHWYHPALQQKVMSLHRIQFSGIIIRFWRWYFFLMNSAFYWFSMYHHNPVFQLQHFHKCWFDVICMIVLVWFSVK